MRWESYCYFKQLHFLIIAKYTLKCVDLIVVMLNLKSLPPCQIAFRENVKRSHLATATMKFSLSQDPPPLMNMTMDATSQKVTISSCLLLPQMEPRWIRTLKTNQVWVQIS